MLYKFETLENKLDELGFSVYDGESGFRVIKGVDFEEAYKSGSISFEEDGIYLEYKGEKYKGYMFIQEAYITYNDSPAKFPKFHVLKCSTINSFIESGRFNQRYEWSNSDVNNLIDKQTRTKYNDQKLVICGNCKRNYLDEIDNTVDFHDTLDKGKLEENNFEVDIFGYVRGKEKISRDYRNSKDYACEKCSITPKSNMHKRWWHTHHVDGDKTNNKIGNLKCLCIVCHSNVDGRHRENFSKGAMPKQIESFKKEYKEELKQVKNLNLYN